MSKKHDFNADMDTLAEMMNNGETVRSSDNDKTEQKTVRPTAKTEVQDDMNKKVNRTPYGDIKLTAHESPKVPTGGEVVITERERVKANLEKNPTGLKRPTYALKSRAKYARTYREAFQMTADLGEKLDDYIKTTKANKSEFIRRAIAHELGKVKDEM